MTNVNRFTWMLLAIVTFAQITGVTTARADQIELHGATYFNNEHSYNKTLNKFIELVNEYAGTDVTGIVHGNGELGGEKDYLTFMNQGISVDFAIVGPHDIAGFVKSAQIMDLPFLFRDSKHWDAAIEAGVFEQIERELKDKADVIVIGYAGGGTRNFISNRPLEKFDDLRDFKMRVGGSPIHAKIFSEFGIRPSVISYNEVYNAIQTQVIEGLENEASAMQQKKFYEVAPYVAKSGHIITIRPILFSGKTFRSLDKELQDAIVKAGTEAGAYGRRIESEQDGAKLQEMVESEFITVYELEGREQMLELTAPVRKEFAEEIDASSILVSIDAL